MITHAEGGASGASTAPQLLRPSLRMPSPDFAGRRPAVDISRILRRASRPFASGIDRIDLALARSVASAHGALCTFLVGTRLGPVALPYEVGAAALEAVDRRWRGESPGVALAIRRALAAAAGRRVRLGGDWVYVNASHDGLPTRAGALDRLDPTGEMGRWIYLHDLIPLEYPEYQTVASVARFERFLREVFSGEAEVAVNSRDTAGRLRRRAHAEGWRLGEIAVLAPRIALEHGSAPGRPPLPDKPYFVALGTIEPRKNHLLLLHVWRDIVSAGPAPTLVIIGRRGWRNDMVVDMLDRCPQLRGNVVELSTLADVETARLLSGARALLFPSFAEGLGLPLLEAAALGVPAVVADLPVFREIAPEGTVFLSPLDGEGWRRRILALTG